MSRPDGGGELRWGVAGRPVAGEDRSGDRVVVAQFVGGWLIAVVDGLGHGPDAADAAEAATLCLEENRGAEPTTLLEMCHLRLRRTRGAVISVASIQERSQTLSWAGVGNVTAIVANSLPGQTRNEQLTTVGGIVGFRLPRLRQTSLSLERGDTFLFATDGIGRGFRDEYVASRSPQHIANAILTRYAVPADDALILVARYENATREGGSDA